VRLSRVHLLSSAGRLDDLPATPVPADRPRFISQVPQILDDPGVVSATLVHCSCMHLVSPKLLNNTFKHPPLKFNAALLR